MLGFPGASHRGASRSDIPGRGQQGMCSSKDGQQLSLGALGEEAGGL